MKVILIAVLLAGCAVARDGGVASVQIVNCKRTPLIDRLQDRAEDKR